MNTKQFIKVTPKGGGRPFVMPVQNHEFYLSQGATITTPTKEEVFAAFPELAERERNAKIAAKAEHNVNVSDTLQHEIAKLHDVIEKKDETIKSLEAEIKRLKSNVIDNAAAESTESTEDVDDTVQTPEKPKRNGGRKKKS